MDTKKISPELIELLSLITSKKLTKKDITPPVLFLANLVLILIGVIYADGKVAEEERARLKITINKFIPPKGNVRELTKLMLKEVSKQELYFKFNAILTLTDPLSIPEKLLLISFGYEMSASDGDMALKERRYLEIVSGKLGIKAEHLPVLEAGFTHQGNLDQKAVEEVKYLLNPGRFHQLDNIFVKAASEMLNTLFPTQKQKNQSQQIVVYEGFKKFKQNRQQLDNICDEIYQIVEPCTNRDLLPSTLISEVDKTSQKLKSQKFQVAVVGEFSQGKSTLLNALLGEEIQPVREIPCSGTITVLKYGEQQRVICHYKDGKEAEIPLTEYQEKASISESAALGNMSDELAQSELEKIFFEHPQLELCKSGVEILDSPGLNEHPDRTAITQKLLEDTDAVIFLTNASRPLTQGEKELIQSIKLQLNNNQIDLPADNLFVLVNFIDLVKSDKGREQIRQRLENFVLGENPIIADESRLHFISAQAALDAILEDEENEYLTYFNNFRNSIENFLTVEGGMIEIQQFGNKINSLISEGIKGLEQAEKVLDGRINLSEEAKQEILEKIGEASGREVKIKFSTKKLKDDTIEQAAEVWNKWSEGLGDRLAEKSAEWHSENSLLWNQKKVIQDYNQEFTSSLLSELNNLTNTEIRDIVVNNLQIFSKEVYPNLKAISMNLQEVDFQIQSNLNEQFNLAVENLETDGFDMTSLDNLGEADDNSSWVDILIGVPIFVGTEAVARIGSFFGIGAYSENAEIEVKQQVYDLGFEKFDESAEEIFNRICENSTEVFYSNCNSVSKVIDKAIFLYENLLEQQEKTNQETKEKLETEKGFISDKQQQLTQLQNQLEIILSQINESR